MPSQRAAGSEAAPAWLREAPLVAFSPQWLCLMPNRHMKSFKVR